MRRLFAKRWALVAGAAAVALVAFLLTRPDDDTRRRAPLTPTSARADLSGVVLQGVGGTTTTTVPQNVGKVVFRGTVHTPGGEFVPRATVRAEWWRVEPPVVVEVLANDQGQFEIRDVAGGRWKLRAYRTPDFASGNVEQFFVDEDSERQVDPEVHEVEEASVTHDIEPDPPITDRNAQLVVAFADRTVDTEGRTITTPMGGIAVTLTSDSAWVRVSGLATEITNAEGRVSWVLKCRQDGTHSLGVSTSLGPRTLDVPACIPISSTSTTSTAPPEAPPPDEPAPAPTTTRP